jgi:hypothetical protein
VLNEASFVYDMPSFLKNYEAMPWDHYDQNTDMAASAPITIRNNDDDVNGRNISYKYEMLDQTGTIIGAAYTGGANILLPYDQIGYSQYSFHSNPVISNDFPNLSDSGTFYVRHMLVDGSRTDTVIYSQRFHNYYAYDDGTAEVGYGLINQYAQLAYKFRNEKATSDTLTAVQMYFLPVINMPNIELRNWTLKVWAADGAAGQPGTMLYQQRNQRAHYNFETPDRFVNYTIDSGTVVLGAGMEYYIGWQQLASLQRILCMSAST